MILNRLKAKKKLNILLCVLESIKLSRRKNKLKTIVCICSETMFKFKGVSAYESKVIFMQQAIRKKRLGPRHL